MDHPRRRSNPILVALVALALSTSCSSNSGTFPGMAAAGSTGMPEAVSTPGAEAPDDGSPTPAEGTSGDADMSSELDMTGGSVGEGGGDLPIAGGNGGDPGSSGPMDATPSPGCGSPAGLANGRASIEVSGKTREYILRVPDNYDPRQPYRLIFGWHPWGGSAQQIERMGFFGLEPVIDEQAILVAPEGQDFQGNGLGWGNAGGEDIDFLHAMVDRFSAELCIDESRIFSTGFSFGAMFSFTLACTADSRMRAIAPQAGNATTSGPCEDGTRSVATMAFIGTEDTLLAGHRRAVDIFVERNGCSTQAAAMPASWCDGLDPENEPCSCVEYPDCEAGYPVVSCEYNAGHQFAPNAGATLWSFFSQF